MVMQKVSEVYCHRCNVKVYPVDKIGPLKGAYFHHQCFKCRFCGLSLNMKNFIQNQLDPDDKEVYCNNHVPKSLAGHVGGDAIGIRSALLAPRKGQSYNEQIRGSDKYNPDMHAVEIQNALLNFKFFREQDSPAKNEMIDNYMLQENDQYSKDIFRHDNKNVNSKLSHSSGNNLVSNGFSNQAGQPHNQYGSNSPITSHPNRNGMENTNLYNGKSYSPTINNFLSQTNSIKTGSLSPLDDIVDYESQIDLERRLRQEEDEMYATFAKKRKQEEGLIEARFREEFHRALQELRHKFEGNSPSPPHLNNPTSAPQGYVKKKMGTGPTGSSGAVARARGGEDVLEREERDLERRLTVKRDKEKDALSRKLMEFERGVAHALIDRHACEMLKFTTLRGARGKQRANILPMTSSTFVMTSAVMSSQISPPLISSSSNMEEMSPSSSRLTYYKDNRSDVGGGSERSRYLAYDYVEAKNSSATKNSASPATYATDMAVSGHRTSPPNDYHDSHNKNSYNFSTEPPSPRPPKCPKSQIYNDPSIFEELDQRAINIAGKNQNTFTDLVRQLTRHCATDVQKARTLFRWITIKNLNNMTFDDNVKLDTPMGLLRGIKLGTESYHMLFKRLCSYAGLHCVVIRGYSKSAGYLPGMKFEEDKRFRNTWNSAFLDGSWRFVQCNWGARHLVNAKDRDTEEVLQPPKINDANGKGVLSVDNLRYEYDDHYFLTDPEQFIYEFFPKQPEWQLLDRSITLEEFENLPFVRSLFFKFGLQFSPSPSNSLTPSLSNNGSSANGGFAMPRQRAIMLADPTGAANLTLAMPSHLVSSLVFHYNLRFYDGDRDCLDNVNMRRYVMQTLVGNSVVFKVHCPCKGDFILDVFANQVNAGDYASGQPMRFKSVCKAKIVSEVLEKIMIPLPDCASGEWGPIKAYKLFGMIPASHEDSVINTSTPRFIIRFRLSPARRLIDFVAALHKNGYDGDREKEKILSKSVVPRWTREREDEEDSVDNTHNDNDCLTTATHSSTNNHNNGSTCSIAFDIALPDEGQYGLDIYAREEHDISITSAGNRSEKYLTNGDAHSSPIMITNNEKRENKNGAVGVKEKHLLTHACKYLINYRLN